ncbi:hypothetical protein BH23CHL7_BH23CHL7_06280 [soil metagenome]
MMRDPEQPDAPESPRTERWVEGDAGLHLDELVVGDLPSLTPSVRGGNTAEIELVGAHIRMSGSLGIGTFRRVSDFLNHHEGLIAIRDATVLRRNGDPTRVSTPSIWVTPNEITLVAVRSETVTADSTMMAQRVARTIVVVTPGHTLTGDVHMLPEADLAVVIESPTPPFLPLTDVRTRSLADRRIIGRYDVAMLNRRHIVAATQLQPGMIPGRTVL